MITPIPDRMDIAEVAEKQFKQTGNAVEVGVWRGEFSAHNLRFWTGNYFMVDLWEFRKDGTADKNMDDQRSWDEIKAEAIRNTKFAGGRVNIYQGDSVTGANLNGSNKFDWIYLDAMHDYDSVMRDMEAWWPKLRSGGLFSGDDYGDQSLRWQEKYGGVARGFNWGVKDAVIDFAKKYGKQFYVTWMNDKTACPAWYMVK